MIGKRTRVLYLFIAFAITSLALQLQGEPLDQWHWRNPLPQGNSLNNIVFANGTYIALGELGTILISNDGTNWVRQESGTTENLRDCAFGNGQYIVVGDFGTILTSTNLISWTAQYAETFYSLNGITYAEGQFVVVGERTTILTSPNGKTWTMRASGDSDLFDIVYAEGLYVAAGGNQPSSLGYATALILTSPDGIVWTPEVHELSFPIVSIAYGNGYFGAISRDDFYNTIWKSGDGTNWQFEEIQNETETPVTSITYGQGKWVIVGNYNSSPYESRSGIVLTSDDLLNWSTAFSDTLPISGVSFGSGQFVAARENGSFLNSLDGSNWIDLAPQILPLYFRDIEYVNGSFVELADNNQLLFSGDGSTWTNTVSLTNVGNFVSIAYGDGRYVAADEFQSVFTSTDGINWTNPAPETTEFPYLASVSLAFGKGLFVGASEYQGEVLTSTDGLNWAVQQLLTNESDPTYFNDITFGADQFVAVANNAIAASHDGTNWTLTSGNFLLTSVTSGDGNLLL